MSVLFKERSGVVVVALLVAVTSASFLQCNDSAVFLNPPFSDTNYHCRCFPFLNAPVYKSTTLPEAFDIHKVSCEFKSYIRDLKQTVSMFDNLLEENSPKLIEELSSFSVEINKQISCEISLAIKKYDQEISSVELKNLNQLLKYFTLRQYSNEPQVKLSRDSVVGLIQVHAKYLDTHTLISLFEVDEIICKEIGRLEKQRVMLHKELKRIFKVFPFESFSQKFKTHTFNNVLTEVKQTGSFKKIFECWNALCQFDAEAFHDSRQSEFDKVFIEDLRNLPSGDTLDVARCRINMAYVLLKDFTDVITVLYSFFMESSLAKIGALNQPANNVSNKLFLTNIIDLYNKINGSPIVETIVTLGGLIEQCAQLIGEWQKEGQPSFTTWFKANWGTIPLFVGIVVIKFLKYLSDKKNNLTSEHSISDLLLQVQQNPFVPESSDETVVLGKSGAVTVGAGEVVMAV